MNDYVSAAAKNVGDIVKYAIKHAPGKKALVFYDRNSELAKVLLAAYRTALPDANFLDHDIAGRDGFHAAIDEMGEGDLVVLIQSATFKLDGFRIRIELYKRGMATIDHMHLERAPDEGQIAIYVDSLAYDPDYYQPLGRALKAKIDGAETIKVICDGTVLTYEGGMEDAKLNVGDYSDMTNVGGTFPIGEVFSEPKNFDLLNGEAMLFAFAGIDHLIQIHEPFKIVIERGILVSHEGPTAFQEVLDQISTDETIMVREFGLGLNPALGKHALLKDITAFERQKGLHFSLGEKHGVYKKPGLNPKKTHYHIDVFVDVRRIETDGESIFSDGDFTV